MPWHPFRAFPDGHWTLGQGQSSIFKWTPQREAGKEEHCVQLCPGVHPEHSLMDTRVGPIEHSQMDPTAGSRSTKRTTGCALAHMSKLFQLLAGFVVWQKGNLGPWSNCTLYSPSLTKWRRRRRNATENKDIGTRKPRESAEKNQTRRKSGDDRMTSFNKKTDCSFVVKCL